MMPKLAPRTAYGGFHLPDVNAASASADAGRVLRGALVA